LLGIFLFVSDRIWCTWSLRALLWSTSSRVSRPERTSTPGDRWEVLTFWPAGWLARVDLVRRTTWGFAGGGSDFQ